MLFRSYPQQDFAHGHREILGTLRQPHLPSVPFEQRVFQIFSKPLKGSTNRRLGDVQSFRSLGDALFAQQRVQHDEQIQIQAFEMHVLSSLDRKSVVSVKMVSVRVDLGGSRLIKKNRTTKHG